MIGPSGKLLDCKTTSVVFPAHDGHVGVWYNHMPMFCELGLGIVRVARTTSGTNQPDLSELGRAEEVLLLVDGGFAMVCSNLLKVVSYDVVFPATLKPESIEQIIARTKIRIRRTDVADQHQHLSKKLSLLQHFQSYGQSPTG